MTIAELWKEVSKATELHKFSVSVQLASEKIFYAGYSAAFYDFNELVNLEEDLANARFNEIENELNKYFGVTKEENGKTLC